MPCFGKLQKFKIGEMWKNWKVGKIRKQKKLNGKIGGKIENLMENQVAKSKNILEKQVAKLIKLKNMVAKLENFKKLKS